MKNYRTRLEKYRTDNKITKKSMVNRLKTSLYLYNKYVNAGKPRFSKETKKLINIIFNENMG